MKPYTVRNTAGAVIGTVYSHSDDAAMEQARMIHSSEEHLTLTEGKPPNVVCYVLGLLDNGRVGLMTSRTFDSEQAAKDYAATCAASRFPFAVRVLT